VPPIQTDILQLIYLLCGPFAAFHGLVHKHHLAREHARTRDDPEAHGSSDYALDDAV
jgi:hypothetical protein